jgi:hypothetical protein
MDKTGEKCQSCNKFYEIIYRIPNNLWKKISGKKDGSGLLCIECLDKIARKKGMYLYWVGTIKKFPTIK